MSKTIYRGGLLLDPTNGSESNRQIIVDGRTVATVLPADADQSAEPGSTVVDLDGQWLCPGLVDLSCALREPGYEQNETIATGLAAAAKGGLTAVCASPETLPVVDNAAVVTQVKERAAGVAGARLIPIGAATHRLKGDALAAYGELKASGCPAVTQGTSAIASANMMRRVLEYAKAFDVVVFHQALEPGCSLRLLASLGSEQHNQAAAP